jgi:hypothetical protein
VPLFIFQKTVERWQNLTKKNEKINCNIQMCDKNKIVSGICQIPMIYYFPDFRPNKILQKRFVIARKLH